MTLAARSFRPDFAGIARRLVPARRSRDRFGIFAGYRAYLVYQALEAKSDAELAALGLRRDDIARAAFAAISSADDGED